MSSINIPAKSESVSGLSRNNGKNSILNEVLELLKKLDIPHSKDSIQRMNADDLYDFKKVIQKYKHV